MDKIQAKIRWAIPLFAAAALCFVMARGSVSAETSGIAANLTGVVGFFLLVGTLLFLVGGVMLISALLRYFRYTRKL